jgi:hypothetical protein
MPEYDITLNVNFWAENQDEAAATSQRIADMVFVEEEVNEVEAPFAPVWRRDT